MRKFIPEYAPSFDERDCDAVSDVVRSGWTSEGKLTKEFEGKISRIVGYKYGVATVNGTVAISLALWAVGVESGDKVIVPDFTFIATAEAAKMIGAIPIFADIREENFGIDWVKVMKRLSGKTKMVVPVHLNGRDAMPSIDLPNIETVSDSAQILGSRVRKSKAAALSFAPNKPITTAQGGMVFTDDAEIAENVRRLKDHGRLDKADYHPFVGFDFKFSDLQAALGLSQLEKLQRRTNNKRIIFKQYQEELKGADLWVGEATDGELLWNQDILVKDRDRLATKLLKMGIQTRPFYAPLHTQPAYKVNGRFPVTEKISSMGLWLPSSPELNSQEVSYVCNSIKKCLR